jgi:recombination protein RecA
VAKRRPQVPAPQRVVDALRKHFKRDDVAILMREGGFAMVRTVCPTGLDVVDRWVVGIGGLPYGRVVQLKGVEASGKTTLLSAMMAAAQRDGALVAFADQEHKFNPAWAEVHGLDVGALVQLQPETLEEFHDQAMYLIDHAPKGPLVVALDSVANCATKRELAEGKDIPAEHAALWTKFLRPATLKLAQRQAILLLVNQPRSLLGNAYGPQETTFAGRALRHSCTVVLDVAHGKGIDADEGGGKSGRYMHVQASKNQVAPPYRKATLRLDYLTGFDDDWSVLDHAKDVGCIAKDAAFIPKNVREARANLGWPEKTPPAAAEG